MRIFNRTRLVPSTRLRARGGFLFGILIGTPFLGNLHVAQALAQNPIPNDMTIIEVSGKLEDRRGNVIQITDDAGKKKSVQLPNDANQITYTGTAKLEWIQPGLFVRLSTELDSKFVPTNPLSEIELFQPSTDRRRNWNEEEMKRNNPGVYPAGVAKGTNLLEEKKNGKEATPQVQRCSVVGQVMMLDKENILVQAGVPRLKLELNDKTKISLQFHSFELARAGDQVKIKGFFNSKTPDQILAQTISIIGSKPLGTEDQSKELAKGANAKPSKNTKTTKPAKKEPNKKPGDPK